ncbi:uncharacterized protein LOC143198818 [Rhynchophorus ferrugineus]|uniref:Uncharacterized protein n=1 Tax=Rhynchophorus ferrugineus TaxID=354439 RepID=A0A834HUA2_RHYFE|nr:hypothetical protein GWI33_019535 [Rhynchophorus ferrugineus]
MKESFILCMAFIILNNVSGICERPNTMTEAEDGCWTKKVEIIDRIQYSTKSVLNFARKKLGFSVEEQNTPQKCEYYQCIFNDLKMLNGNGYPNYDQIVHWIDNNIIYNHAKEIYERLNSCNRALSESISNNQYFTGDLNSTLQDNPTNELQSTCDTLQEFMKCLSIVNCQIFRFP